MISGTAGGRQESVQDEFTATSTRASSLPQADRQLNELDGIMADPEVWL